MIEKWTAFRAWWTEQSVTEKVVMAFAAGVILALVIL